MGAELCPADGQTDMTKLTVAFRNSAHGPKNEDSPKQYKPIALCNGVRCVHCEVGT
jgi:hypothetical protein